MKICENKWKWQLGAKEWAEKEDNRKIKIKGQNVKRGKNSVRKEERIHNKKGKRKQGGMK